MQELQLTETAVSTRRGVRFGLSNVWTDALEGPDGPREVLRGTVSVMFEDEARDFDRRLAEGDVLTLDGERLEVTRLVDGDPRGSMTLRPLSPEAEASPSPGRPSAPFGVVDFALLVFLASAPHVFDAARYQLPISLLGLLTWLWLVRPTWRGLLGFFGTALLILQAVGFAVWWLVS